MKKKVAVFTNGWNDDYLDFALEGIRRRASQDNYDVFVFLDYTSYDKTKEELTGELNILNLPKFENFDGVLLLGNTLNNAGENMILRDKILKAGIPSICLEYELDGINCIRTVANVIKRTVPVSWKAVRYGGDEYIIIGDYDMADEAMYEMKREAHKNDINK